MRSAKGTRRARLGGVAAALLLASTSAPASAAPGDPDKTFGDNGTVTTDFGATDPDRAFDMVIQSDGRIVLVGQADLATVDVAIARYRPGGTLDRSFAGDGRRTDDLRGGFDRAQAVALQEDGKIVVVGSAFDGSDDMIAVLRYKSGGTPDAGFSGDGVRLLDVAPNADDALTAVAIQPDGRIVVAGSSGSHMLVARFRATGGLDTSFAGDGLRRIDLSAADAAAAALVRPDGRIVVGGTTSVGGGDFALARLKPNGVLDTSFSGDGVRIVRFSAGTDGLQALARQGGGKIVAAGFAAASPTDDDFAVARLRKDGSPDTRFGGGDGLRTFSFGRETEQALDVASQPNGKIVVAGWAWNGADEDFAVARLTDHGFLDSKFGEDGRGTTHFGTGNDHGAAVAIDAHGRIVVAGYARVPLDDDFGAARYLA